MPAPDQSADAAGGQVPGLMVYVDAGLRVRFANRYCLDLIGHAPEDIIDRCLADLVDPGTLKYALAHVADLRKGNARPRDYVLRTRDGMTTKVRIQLVADCDAEGRSVGYFVRSSEPARERQLQGAHTLLQATLDKYLTAGTRLSARRELDHTRRELVATANHELLTPLASVIAALELLRESACPGNMQAADCLPIALDNADRLANVVARWLDVERIGLGITPVRRDPLDLGELARHVVAECRELADRPDLRLDCRAAAVLVAGDAQRLREVVRELVMRAVGRSPSSAAVRVYVEARAARAILRVEDDGDAVDSGTSLALALSKAVASRLGGTLQKLDCAERGGAYELALPLDGSSRSRA